jgi:hypothetical protein
MNKAWIAKLSPDGTTLIYSGFLGGSLSDISLGLAVDASKNVYVVGGTYSRDFPVSSNATQATLNGTLNAFITKLDPKGNRLYSTYLGGSELETAFGIAVDPAGNFYVGGDTQSDDFPVTNNALQSRRAGDNETFVAKFSPDGVLLFDHAGRLRLRQHVRDRRGRGRRSIRRGHYEVERLSGRKRVPVLAGRLVRSLHREVGPR